MKLAISALGQDLDSNLDLRFGRAQYFIIYDLENEEFEAIENRGFTARGGAGIATAQQLLDKAIGGVISGNFGPNAYELLRDGEVRMFKADERPIGDIIEDFKANKLREVEAAGPSYKGGS